MLFLYVANYIDCPQGSGVSTWSLLKRLFATKYDPDFFGSADSVHVILALLLLICDRIILFNFPNTLMVDATGPGSIFKSVSASFSPDLSLPHNTVDSPNLSVFPAGGA